jgi:hypothetical protein
MKKLILVFAAVLSGCAQTYWVHPSKSPNQLQGDVASCQNEAMRSVPYIVAAPVAPVYVAPTQYSTNCSTMGIYTNCSTTAQPDKMERVMQQNAQNMAQAGSNIGTAWSQKRYTENCLQAFGWSEQKMSALATTNVLLSERLSVPPTLRICEYTGRTTVVKVSDVCRASWP